MLWLVEWTDMHHKFPKYHLDFERLQQKRKIKSNMLTFNREYS